jgi:hypothetical protein
MDKGFHENIIENITERILEGRSRHEEETAANK